MARLEKYGEYQYSDYTQTKVEYAAPLSDNSYRQQPLKDNVFYTFSKAPYSRKKARIYQYADGYINLDGGEKVQIANTIVFDKDCARFIPIMNPTTNIRTIPSTYPSRWSIDQTGIEWLPDIIQDPRFSNFQSGIASNGDMNWGYEFSNKGGIYQSISPLIKWQMNAFVVLPIVCGIYLVISGNVENGCNYFHYYPTLIDDYFADPTTIPEQFTHPSYGQCRKIGHVLLFKIVGNRAYNSLQQGNAKFPVNDCGIEFDKKDGMSILVGGYGQDSFPHYDNQLYGNYETEPFCQPFNAPWCLLGIAPHISSYPNSTEFTPENLDFALARGKLINTNNSYGREINIYQMCVVGDLQYLDFIPGIAETLTSCRIGYNYNDVGIYAPIPVIKSEYMTRDFLMKVAGQMGLPMITKSAKATEYVNSNDLEQWIANNEGNIYMPDVDLDTGEVKDKPPEPLSEIPADDDRRKLFDSKNPLNDVKEMDTSDIDPNNYTEETALNEPNLTAVGKFNRYYALSNHDIDNLVDFLYTDNASTISNILDGLKLNGENPMNFLIALKMFPFDIGEFADTSSETITFGNGVNTGVTAERINDFTSIIDLGSCTFRPYNKNFYDYEPYTNAKLYIPYCGEVTVSTAQFVGHTINVKLIVDIITGACCGVVFCDKIAINYVNGNIGVEIAVTGENATKYVEATGNAIKGAVASVGSIAGGNIMGGVLSGLETAREFNNIPTPLETNGTTTAQIGFFKPQRCYFIVQSPIPIYTDLYGNKVGYACEVSRTLNEVSGFTVCENVSITPPNATLDEIEEIKSLLESGVYL